MAEVRRVLDFRNSLVQPLGIERGSPYVSRRFVQEGNVQSIGKFAVQLLDGMLGVVQVPFFTGRGGIGDQARRDEARKEKAAPEIGRGLEWGACPLGYFRAPQSQYW